MLLLCLVSYSIFRSHSVVWLCTAILHYMTIIQFTHSSFSGYLQCSQAEYYEQRCGEHSCTSFYEYMYIYIFWIYTQRWKSQVIGYSYIEFSQICQRVFQNNYSSLCSHSSVCTIFFLKTQGITLFKYTLNVFNIGCFHFFYQYNF